MLRYLNIMRNKRSEKRELMYIPKYFAIQDEEMKYEIMEQNSFATLFSQHNGEPYATHLPLLLNRRPLFYMVTSHVRMTSGKIVGINKYSLYFKGHIVTFHRHGMKQTMRCQHGITLRCMYMVN